MLTIIPKKEDVNQTRRKISSNSQFHSSNCVNFISKNLITKYNTQDRINDNREYIAILLAIKKNFCSMFSESFFTEVIFVSLKTVFCMGCPTMIYAATAA